MFGGKVQSCIEESIPVKRAKHPPLHDLLVGPSLGSYYRLPTPMEYNLKNIEVMADRGDDRLVEAA